MDATDLQEQLNARGMTHQDLASTVGVSRAAVTQWCLGSSRPGGPARRLIAQALDLPLDEVDRMFDGADGSHVAPASGPAPPVNQELTAVAAGTEG